MLLLVSALMATAAGECWRVDAYTGPSLEAPEYRVQEDALQGQTVCFYGDHGWVTGNDLEFTQFGDSTLIGWGHNGRGMEVVNVYQLDRANNMMMTTATRVGTRTEVPLLPDYASAFVGRAERVR